MLLITINKAGNRVLHPDAAKLEPNLEKLSEEELLLIILAYDYYSPFRQLSEQERMRRAHAQIFGDKKKNIWDSPKIKDAITAYMGLQYDERREQVRTYLSKIATINEAIRVSESPTEIKRYIDTNTNLRAAVNTIEMELLMDEEQESVNIQGKGKLSWLEKFQRNKDKYKEVTRKRITKEEKTNETESEG